MLDSSSTPQDDASYYAKSSEGQVALPADFARRILIFTLWFAVVFAIDRIVYEQAIPGWTKEGCLKTMEDFLQTEQEFNVVATQWYTASIAAAQAIEGTKWEGKVYIVGLDWSKEWLPYLMDGKIHSGTAFGIAKEGYLGVETAAKYLRGEDVPKVMINPEIIIHKDNIEEFGEPEL